jgi:chaperone modulatory protein CbpM
MSEYNISMTVVEVCQCARLPLDTLVEIVDTGIVEPTGSRPQEWLFDSQMVVVIQKAHRLQRDLETDWNGVALALGLLDELRSVRAENDRLRRLIATAG